MSRGMGIFALVFVTAIVAVIGYYSLNEGTVDMSGQCVENFDRFAGINNNVTMELQEFLTHEPGISQDEFTKADKDGNNALSIQEFCAWESPGSRTG